MMNNQQLEPTLYVVMCDRNSQTFTVMTFQQSKIRHVKRLDQYILKVTQRQGMVQYFMTWDRDEHLTNLHKFRKFKRVDNMTEKLFKRQGRQLMRSIYR
ncbi:hypothetical protein KMW28_27130 [Flammeovirga yaeyamensis]|uniref:Uncharacterized protein n=1 Tax=Flammeovirga yaeyamensis TaxID=367791 RepID=A0AAX1NAI1_9BACT|nr:hypothetical protein [Flammeovirga yaeyamensis]MBB3700046.1 hypothetical protein [Flammeovirga yaeyamensis]NMF37517.1 hypothetical protein [Flammeovirga yaeyamensis]QWG04574.1 hypothetical protein KMW28_27130 [Flammeovirga yaeyamensis]